MIVLTLWKERSSILENARKMHNTDDPKLCTVYISTSLPRFRMIAVNDQPCSSTFGLEYAPYDSSPFLVYTASYLSSLSSPRTALSKLGVSGCSLPLHVMQISPHRVPICSDRPVLAGCQCSNSGFSKSGTQDYRRAPDLYFNREIDEIDEDIDQSMAGRLQLPL
ncbi:hypothetical protein C8R42DRAFT_608495 [Lentinula raphanica]|nr:hypothetical protein C8R42DRAFT_608495 [Lentinula raphanica]